MTEIHVHKWLPLIHFDEENGQAPCGSLGSQIGYICLECNTQDIRWPDMAARTPGMTEKKLMQLNREIVK